MHQNTKICVHFQGKNTAEEGFKIRKPDAADPTERCSLTFRVRERISQNFYFMLNSCDVELINCSQNFATFSLPS